MVYISMASIRRGIKHCSSSRVSVAKLHVVKSVLQCSVVYNSFSRYDRLLSAPLMLNTVKYNGRKVRSNFHYRRGLGNDAWVCLTFPGCIEQ